VHSVTPVTKGVRLAAFFWIQSMVRDDPKRVLLFELDRAIQKVAADQPGQSALTDLAGVYHNLLRLWADS
jgi:PKHD-type hydroxylase